MKQVTCAPGGHYARYHHITACGNTSLLRQGPIGPVEILPYFAQAQQGLWKYFLTPSRPNRACGNTSLLHQGPTGPVEILPYSVQAQQGLWKYFLTPSRRNRACGNTSLLRPGPGPVEILPYSAQAQQTSPTDSSQLGHRQLEGLFNSCIIGIKAHRRDWRNRVQWTGNLSVYALN